MKYLDLPRVQRKLLEEGYSGREINLLIDDLRNIPQLSSEAQELMMWVEEGKISEDVQKRMTTLNLTFPAAFIETRLGVKRKLFSEDDDIAISGVLGGSLLLGKGKAGHKIGKGLHEKFKRTEEEVMRVGDNRKILRKLVKGSGVPTWIGPENKYDRALILRPRREKAAKLIRKGRKTGDKKALEEGLKLAEKLRGVPKEFIELTDKNASAFVHELGHINQFKSNRALPFLAHHAKRITKSPVYKGALGVDGFVRGVRSVGEDEDGINHKKALKSAALGTLLHTPVVLNEGAASARGLKLLKKAGASKELMKASKKNLGVALGTYLVRPGVSAATELGGHELGVAYGVLKRKRNGQNKNNRS